jgi:hypothetical protein
MNKGWLLIGFGALGIAMVYFATHRGHGRSIRNAGQPNTPKLTSVSLDGSASGIAVNPQVQTEAAYQQTPTVMSDAFGPGESVPAHSGQELSSDMVN